MSTTSAKYSVNWKDAIGAAIFASIASPLLVVLTALSQGNFNIDWTVQWHVAVSNLAAYLIRQYFAGPKYPVPTSQPSLSDPPSSSAGPKNVAILIGLLVISTFARGQSMLRPLPLMPAKVPVHSPLRAILLPTDSVPPISNGKFQGFRFSGPDITFAIPDFSAYTGLGIDWVSATADAITGKWSYNWTVGPRVYGGANLGVPTLKLIGAVGLRATFFKGWLAISGIYNLTTKKPQTGVGNPAALIPGLN
jgi:hypothetical protein